MRFTNKTITTWLTDRLTDCLTDRDAIRERRCEQDDLDDGEEATEYALESKIPKE